MANQNDIRAESTRRAPTLITKRGCAATGCVQYRTVAAQRKSEEKGQRLRKPSSGRGADSDCTQMH
eukprot:15446317-Alexandrium_andersonii.AAC.1